MSGSTDAARNRTRPGSYTMLPFGRLRPVTILCLALLATGVAAADRVVESQDTVIRYRAFVPGDVPTLRGVIIGSMGSNWDYRHFVHRRAWQAAARQWGFALLGTDNNKKKAWREGDDKLIADLEAALASIADQVGHPELTNAAICSFGFSAGASYSIRLGRSWPKRTLAVGLGGSAPNWMLWAPDAPTEGFRTVPILLTQGDKDDLAGVEWFSQWRDWRRRGFLIALAGQWGLSHFEGNYENLMLLHFDSAIRARLPAEWDPTTGPPQLKLIPEETGWVGDLDGCEKWGPMLPSLVPAKAVSSEQRASRCWFIDERIGRAWQAYAPQHNSVSLVQPYCDSADYIPSRELPMPHPPDQALVLSATTRWLGSVQSVSFYANSEVIATVDASDAVDDGKVFTASWAKPRSGVYAIYAVFTTRGGKQCSTKPCPLVVSRSP